LNQISSRITIVDDNDGVRRTFSTVLQCAEYSVIEYASSQHFLDEGLSGAPDCIVLDLEMPSPNGVEVLDQLQMLAFDTPIVVVTGTNDRCLLKAAERECVVAILRKPIGPDELLVTVAKALS
jgi:FixJ family two-component response regulator